MKGKKHQNIVEAQKILYNNKNTTLWKNNPSKRSRKDQVMRKNLQYEKKKNKIHDQDLEETANVIIKTLLKSNVKRKDIKQLSGKSYKYIRKISLQLEKEI